MKWASRPRPRQSAGFDHRCPLLRGRYTWSEATPGQRNWWTIQGALDAKAVVFSVFETRDGRNLDPAPVNHATIGQGEIFFSSCTQASLIASANGRSVEFPLLVPNRSECASDFLRGRSGGIDRRPARLRRPRRVTGGTVRRVFVGSIRGPILRGRRKLGMCGNGVEWGFLRQSPRAVDQTPGRSPQRTLCS